MQKNYRFYLATFLVVFSQLANSAETPPPTKPPLLPADIAELPGETERVDVYLLIGQSNMKGRGHMPTDPLNDPQIVMMHLKTDQWFLARHPLHLTGDPVSFRGADNAGVGPGLKFAEILAAHDPKTRIALLPCARGGSSIALWKRGKPLYDNAIRRAKLALAAGPTGKTRLAGALWLQGEADAKPGKIDDHAARLATLVDHLREDLDSPKLPFIACTIGEMKPDPDLTKKMNLILLDLPKQRRATGCVDARDQKTHIGDRVHFDTAAQEEMGRRFAAELVKITKTP